MSVQPPRIRRDPRDPASMRARAPAATVAPRPTTTVTIDAPACLVMAVVDLEAGRLSRSDREVMGAARQLSDALGGAVIMTAFLPAGTELRMKPEAEGADRLLLLPSHDDLPETRVADLVAAAEFYAVKHILFAETFGGGELARRAAARLGDRAAFAVRRLGRDGIVADIDAGVTEVSRPLPRVVVIADGVFAPVEPAPSREARRIEGPAPSPQAVRVRVAGALPLDPASVSLTEADLILSAGNGLTDWPGFHAVAAALGAAEAGSRVVCDAGLLPRTRQVGASGLLVEPKCYIALGIAGASQHLQGIAGAERVIAINSDPRCDMIRRADLAIVADVQAVLPALVRKAGERRSAERGANPSFRGGEAEPGIGEPLTPGRGAPIPDLRSAPSGMRVASTVSKITNVILLASLGRHPISKRPRRPERDARALELALSTGWPVTALHAGPAGSAEGVLREQVGAGAADVTVLDTPADSDPLPTLEAYLRTHNPSLIVAGARAEAGECSGLTPFWLAEKLGIGLATNIVSLEIEGATARMVQALPGGRRRRLEAALPLIVTVERSGPEPRLSARMRALRATIQVEPGTAVVPDERHLWSQKPSRPRPKRLLAPKASGQGGADAEGRREMIGPAPDEAAEAILEFLERDGLIASKLPKITEAAA